MRSVMMKLEGELLEKIESLRFKGEPYISCVRRFMGLPWDIISMRCVLDNLEVGEMFALSKEITGGRDIKTLRKKAIRGLYPKSFKTTVMDEVPFIVRLS